MSTDLKTVYSFNFVSGRTHILVTNHKWDLNGNLYHSTSRDDYDQSIYLLESQNFTLKSDIL